MADLDKMSPRQIRGATKKQVVAALNQAGMIGRASLLGQMCGFNNWKVSTNLAILEELELSGIINFDGLSVMIGQRPPAGIVPNAAAEADNILGRLAGEPHY